MGNYRPMITDLLLQPKIQKVKGGCRLVYLALITSKECNNIGIMRCYCQDLAYASGLKYEDIETILPQLEDAKLIVQENGYILITDFLRWAYAKSKQICKQDNMIVEMLRLYAQERHEVLKKKLLKEYSDIFSIPLEQAEAEREKRKREQYAPKNGSKKKAKQATDEVQEEYISDLQENGAIALEETTAQSLPNNTEEEPWKYWSA